MWRFLLVAIGSLAWGQDSGQIAEKASQSVAMVLAREAGPESRQVTGTAFVIRENGVLLTALHVVKNVAAVQVRLKNGEVFDDVQLLGVDERRDIAALKIAGSGLSTLPTAPIGQTKAGDGVLLVSHAAALPWSISTGVISGQRMAEEVPGAGQGYRLVQFTAAAAPGSSGGLLVDAQGRAVAIVTGSSTAGQNLNFAVPVESVAGLADAAPTRRFASGANLTPVIAKPSAPAETRRDEAVSISRDVPEVLRRAKTVMIESRTVHFGTQQVNAALVRTAGFRELGIAVVDDSRLADIVLQINYTFPWDFPFEVKHRETTALLLAGKGVGPFSPPAGAASVAKEFVKIMKPYRTVTKK